MKKPIILALLTCASLAACISAEPDNSPAINPEVSLSQSGSIVFFRGHSLQASLANAWLGSNDGYFLGLDEDQYVRIDVETGFHEFKVRAQGSVAFKSAIKVNAAETVCVEVRPNHEELEWLLVPVVNALIPSFTLRETVCPGPADLGELAAI
jgi:hypothetical protein